MKRQGGGLVIVGLMFGLILGVVLKNIPLGLVLGLAFGALGLIAKRRR